MVRGWPSVVGVRGSPRSCPGLFTLVHQTGATPGSCAPPPGVLEGPLCGRPRDRAVPSRGCFSSRSLSRSLSPVPSRVLSSPVGRMSRGYSSPLPPGLVRSLPVSSRSGERDEGAGMCSWGRGAQGGGGWSFPGGGDVTGRAITDRTLTWRDTIYRTLTWVGHHRPHAYLGGTSFTAHSPDWLGHH